MTRYAIIGAGAVGVTLAAELSGIGREVVLVGRGQQLERLRAGQLHYLRPEGARVVDVPAVGGPDEITLHHKDILVLATKSQQADGVLAEWARQPVGDGDHRAGDLLPVFTLQNGLDAERSALRRFASVVGSVLWVPASYVADGEVLSPGAPAKGVFWLGDHPDAVASAASVTIAADLAAAGFEVQVVSDLSRWKTAKLLSSVTFALDALYAAGPERDRAARLLEAETRDVLAAAGLQPADIATESTVRLNRFRIEPVEGHRRPGSSTWQSLARGRDAETDFLNGEVVLLARQLGRRAPINAALLARVQRAVHEATQPGSLPAADLAQLLAEATVLVDSATLRTELGGARPPVLLDVRWALNDPDGEKHYLDGHLPGAVFADLSTELAAPHSSAAGRHPLPALADLQEAARRWGLRAGRAVVVYDDNGGQSAARAWWLLRWAGVSDVRILDGGLGSWTAAGGQLNTGSYQAEPGDVELTAGNLPVLDADEAAALAGQGVLLDARAGERYRGESEPIDSRAGHIPGAISMPTSENLTADGRFLPVAQLRQRFAGILGAPAGQVAVYCGSGVTAAHEIAALQAAGIDAALYPGSWSAWSADASRPVATGVGPDLPVATGVGPGLPVATG